MATKNFKEDLGALFESTQEKAAKKRPGKKQNPDVVRGVSIQEGLHADYQRATYIVKCETVKTLDNIAYTERKTIKVLINEILEDYIKKETAKLNKAGQEILTRPGKE